MSSRSKSSDAQEKHLKPQRRHRQPEELTYPVEYSTDQQALCVSYDGARWRAYLITSSHYQGQLEPHVPQGFGTGYHFAPFRHPSEQHSRPGLWLWSMGHRGSSAVASELGCLYLYLRGRSQLVPQASNFVGFDYLKIQPNLHQLCASQPGLSGLVDRIKWMHGNLCDVSYVWLIPCLILVSSTAWTRCLSRVIRLTLSA